jgi:hypothetical protein
MTAARPTLAPPTPDRRPPPNFTFAAAANLAHLPRTLSKYGSREHHWRIRSKMRFFAPILAQTIPDPLTQPLAIGLRATLPSKLKQCLIR